MKYCLHINSFLTAQAYNGGMKGLIEKPAVRKTYPQNWTAYNAAQTSEKEHFLRLLYELSQHVEDVPRESVGRPRLPPSDMVFAVCYKIYSTVSGRRFMTDLRQAHADGYISQTPHFNSIFNYLEDLKLTTTLQQLITITSLPLKAIETDFAVDSSGFTTSQCVNWNQLKYRKHPSGAEYVHDWIKAHIMCGVRTNIITSVEIHGRYTNDTVAFPDLVAATAENFKISEVSADKAYCSGYNFKVVEDFGGTPFIAFKKNNKAGTRDDIWRKMFYHFQLNRDDYLSRYHKRSNVETTFSMVKRKFGDHLRSKTQTARVNEVLAKLLCHNICVLIQEMHELGLDINLAAPAKPL